MFKTLQIASWVVASMAFTGLTASAADYTVEMKNKGEAGLMVFEPALSRIAVGDTITFVSVDKGHNAETIKDMIPEGAAPFKGKISQDIAVTFDVPGAYAIKCMPHLALGMVALVVVGDDPANLDAIKEAKFPSKAAARFEAMFAELSAE